MITLSKDAAKRALGRVVASLAKGKPVLIRDGQSGDLFARFDPYDRKRRGRDFAQSVTMATLLGDWSTIMMAVEAYDITLLITKNDEPVGYLRRNDEYTSPLAKYAPPAAAA